MNISSLKSPKSLFSKNLHAFFDVFLGMKYENTLFVDETLYKSLFNLPFNAIFLETFYRSQANGDYLFKTIFLYLEALHFGM
jgi:hypothetical protein